MTLVPSRVWPNQNGTLFQATELRRPREPEVDMS